jgi:hypothetical protein
MKAPVSQEGWLNGARAKSVVTIRFEPAWELELREHRDKGRKTRWDKWHKEMLDDNQPAFASLNIPISDQLCLKRADLRKARTHHFA